MTDRRDSKGGSAPPRTLADVAKALRLDASTISLALSGSPKISDKTRRRVLEYCEKAHFQPNRLARGLARGRSGLIGILVPSVKASFFPQMLGGIEEGVSGLGMASLLAVSNHEPLLLRKQLQLMHASRVEGLLISPTGHPEERELLLPLVRSVPTVWFLHPLQGDPPEACVRVDDERGAYLGTRHLLQHGHRRIGYLEGPSERGTKPADVLVLRRRLEGWRRALREYGVEPDPQLVAGTDFTNLSGYQAAASLLELPERPTAFMASSDYAALGAVELLLERGLRPGQDVAVVGYDGICCATNSPIPLTTVNQPKRELGLIAAQTLAAMLGGARPAMPMLEPALLIRRSCGCLSAHGSQA